MLNSIEFVCIEVSSQHEIKSLSAFIDCEENKYERFVDYNYVCVEVRLEAEHLNWIAIQIETFTPGIIELPDI